jgi:hypothetical protein
MTQRRQIPTVRCENGLQTFPEFIAQPRRLGAAFFNINCQERAMNAMTDKEIQPRANHDPPMTTA